ncbi:Protein of unknown function [Chitinophaga costaii]|uniref:DUF3810 domain-containing protein n=1 Tax=Chitinophaga costaii TaxID=1335309 RepID=A0A1C4E999_9BACT|nr:DUF3810 domain-containing protein [Chitinophaga costaii]PUZ24241.1 DUF3810 domain-containing protein [Chitinophaga costaii]SCC40052.1 Protein of unknown function [Chitinophaga costaii]
MELKAKINRQLYNIASLIVVLLLLKWAFESAAFSRLYFHRWYPWVSAIFRSALGIVKLSVGDVIYSVWVVTAFIFLLKVCYKAITLQWQQVCYALLKGVRALLGLYLAFLLLWGYNYQHDAVEENLGIKSGEYSDTALQTLADTLLREVNELRPALGDTFALRFTMPNDSLFAAARAAYSRVADSVPVLRYRHPSVKGSLFAHWMNYMNVGGYLNPFTGEAQVNTTVPGFLLPFNVCHEMAHQLGYAREEEANFIGFLAASHSADLRFRYGAHYEMLLYTIGQLGHRNDTLAKTLWQQAYAGVRNDYRAVIKFYKPYHGAADAYATLLYDRYLKANNQEAGIESYNEVVAWLLAYYKIR